MKGKGFNEILIIPGLTDSTGRTRTKLPNFLEKMKIEDGYFKTSYFIWSRIKTF